MTSQVIIKCLSNDTNLCYVCFSDIITMLFSGKHLFRWSSFTVIHTRYNSLMRGESFIVEDCFKSVVLKLCFAIHIQYWGPVKHTEDLLRVYLISYYI